MKKTRKKQKEQGITLIALVVTIVVLLILAATSIAMLTGDDGIITNAQKAQVANQEAEVIDKMGLAYSTVRTEAMVKMSTDPGYQPIAHIEELANIAAKEIGLENAEKVEVPEIVDNGYHVYYQDGGSTITMIYGDKKFSLKAGSKAENNKYANLEGEISLSSTEVKYSKMPKRTSEFKEKRLSDFVKVGDYVKYIPGEDNYYTSYGKVDSDIEGNGVKDYKFQSKNDTKWRVWDITENGSVRIISEDYLYTGGLTGEKLSFNGKNGWRNATKEIDNICSIYGHGNGAINAKNINENDINKIVNWIKPDSSAGKYYGHTFTYYSNYSTNTFDDKRGSYTKFELIDGRIPTDENPIIIKNDMWRPLITAENLKVAEGEKTTYLELLKGNYKGSNKWENLYWVTGEQPYYGLDNLVIYNVYIFSARLEVGSTTVTRTDRKDGDFIALGIRPIVTLDSNLKYKSGTGKMDDLIEFTE